MANKQQQPRQLVLLLCALPLFLAACAVPVPSSSPAVPAAKTAEPTPLNPPAPQFTVLGDANFPALLHYQVAALDDVLTDTPAPLPPPDDLWERIRRGFALPDHDNPGVKPDRDWYADHASYLERVADRAGDYLYFILQEIDKRHMPSEIALLPIVESAYYPFAYSHGRASGIWQFIPSTGRRYGLKQNWWYDGRRDIYASTNAALDYLQTLHDQFNGDWLLALAAYNSGEGTVDAAIRRNKRRGKPTDFWSLDLPPETRGYVPKLLALADLVAKPADYGIAFDPIPNEPYFKRVHVDSQIDLALAAELADIDIDELYRLNPGYNRWATDPNGPHYLLLPVDKVEGFEERLAELPADKRVKWIRHRIGSGESLNTIAREYHTTVDVLQRVNRLSGHVIRAGGHLIIPVASRNPSAYSLSAEQRRRATQDTPRRGRKVVYIVNDGDTLWNLARKHRVSVGQLAKWNGMAPRDPLMPGQRIVIWSQAQNVSSFKTSMIVPPPRRSVTQRVGYTVRPGDSLARISQRFKVTVAQLRKWNGLHDGKYLHPGQYLTLYVDVTRQADNI